MVRGGVVAPAVAPRTRLSLAFVRAQRVSGGFRPSPYAKLSGQGPWRPVCVPRGGRAGGLASVHPPLRLLTRGLWVV